MMENLSLSQEQILEIVNYLGKAFDLGRSYERELPIDHIIAYEVEDEFLGIIKKYTSQLDQPITPCDEVEIKFVLDSASGDSV